MRVTISLVRRCYLSLINVAKNGYPFTIHCSYTSAVLCGSFAVKDQLCLNFCLPDAIGRYKFCFLLFSPQSTQSSAKMREGTHPVRTVRHSLLITHYSLLTACCFLLTCLPAGRGDFFWPHKKSYKGKYAVKGTFQSTEMIFKKCSLVLALKEVNFCFL
jgi:hypothetical protein